MNSNPIKSIKSNIISAQIRKTNIEKTELLSNAELKTDIKSSNDKKAVHPIHPIRESSFTALWENWKSGEAPCIITTTVPRFSDDVFRRFEPGAL